MPTTEAILRYRSEGLDKAVAGAKQMGEATAVLGDRTEKLTRAEREADNALKSVHRTYDTGFRQVERMVNAQDRLNRALAQGLIDAQNYERMNAQIAATTAREVEAAQRRAAANDNLSGSFAELSRTIGLGIPLLDRFMGLAGRGVPIILGATVLAGLVAGTKAIAEARDQYTMFENQLKAAGVAEGRARDVTRELAASAVAARVPVEGLVSLYGRLTRVSGELGLTQADVKRGTDILAKSLATSGLTTQEASAGVLQLSQALQSGRLNGDELRSVLENMPSIAQAIAREFKTTIGGLRQLGSEGELTADRVFKAILSAGPEIEATFAKTQPTIAQATTATTTAFQHLAAEMDRILNLSPTIAAVVMKVANVAESAAQGVGNFQPSARAKQIEDMVAYQRRLEDLLATAVASGDTSRAAGLRTQVEGAAQAVELLTRASAGFVDQKIDDYVGKIEPPLRFATDEMQRLTAEATTASGQLPGLAGALNGVAGAAGTAAAQIASVAAGIRSIQSLNPDLSGVLGYVDKAKQINDAFEATKKRIQSDFAESGNSELATKQLTEAVKAQQDALKGLNAERNKPVQDYVRQGELSQMTDLGRALAQNADGYSKLADQRRKDTEFLASQAKTPEDAARIRAQGAEVIAQLDNARRLLDAKTKADAATKAAKQSARDNAPDAYDTALQRSRDQIEEMQLQAQSAGKATEQVYALTEANRLRRAALSAGREIDADLTRQIDEQSDAYARQRKATEDALEGQRRLQEGVRALGQEFGGFVQDVLMGGRSMGQAFDSLAKSLGGSGLQALLTGQGSLAGILGTAPTEKGGVGGLLGMDLGKLFDSSVLEKAVAKGTERGTFDGISPLVQPRMDKAGNSMGFFSSPLGQGIASAGVGASVGYSSASPLAGALFGGLAGLMSGNPLLAVAGAGAGLLGGSCGHTQSKKRERDHERRQRVQEFQACGDADGCVAVPA